MNQYRAEQQVVRSAWPEDMPQARPQSPGLSLMDIRVALRSQRLAVLAILGLFSLIGAAFAMQQKTFFYAHALVALGSGQPQQLVDGEVQQKDMTAINTEVETLSSTAMLNRVIDLLGPVETATAIGFDQPEYFADLEAPATAPPGEGVAAPAPDPAAPAIVPASADTEAAPEAPDVRFSINDILPMENGSAGSVEFAAHSRREYLVRALQESVTVRRRTQSDVIEVGFTTAKAADAVTLSNAIMSAYLQSKADQRLEAAQRASEWLQARVSELGGEVQAKERAIASYRVNNQLLSVQGSTIAEQRYSALQQQVVDARAELITKEATQRQMSYITGLGADNAAVDEIVNSVAVDRLRNTQSQLLSRKAELSENYGPQHPQMRAIDSELSEVRNQIANEIDRVRAATDNEVRVVRARVADLEAQLGSLEGKLISGGQADVNLKALEREVESSSSVYENLSIAAREIAQRESLKVVDARIVSQPILPLKPSSPPALLWIVLFTSAGALAAVAFALGRNALRDTIIRPETVAHRIGAESLISVPKLENWQLRERDKKDLISNLYVVKKPLSAFTENFRVLSTYLLGARQSQGRGQVVAVTSAEVAEGKTTISLSLGRTSAMLGMKVIIIDGDQRRPSLSQNILADQEARNYNLLDVLHGEAHWRDALVHDQYTKMDVLPIIYRDTPDNAKLFETSKLAGLLEELRGLYDLVLIDCPPVLAVAESRIFCGLADKTLLVNRWNHTRAAVTATARREIERADGDVFGVVLNMVHTPTVQSLSHTDVLNYGRGGKGYYERDK